MSKTFKSAVSHREVRIWPTDAGFAIAVLDDVSNESTSTQLAPADAPAIALAILEAAQGDNEECDAHVASAIHTLRAHGLIREHAAKEAADREALEREAWELYKANKPDTPSTGFEPGHHAHTVWLRVARKARELHKAVS